MVCILATAILIGAIIPLWLGAGSSSHHQVDSAGILQVLWVVQQHPDSQRYGSVGEVSIPTTENLRRAGMDVEVNLMSLESLD